MSSRTYLSTLERGMKSPTLSKITAICEVLGVHPMTLMMLSYTGGNPPEIDRLIARMRQEIGTITTASKK